MSEQWWLKYVGRQWEGNVYDCGALVMDVERNEFNREIYLPVERGDYSLKEMQNIIRDQLGYFDDQVEDVTASPQSGDVVLMKWNGRDTHVGIYVINKGVPYVLHNVEQTGVIFTKVSRLNRLNCSISGIYRPKINTPVKQGSSIGANHPLPAPAITEP